ncbi:MAG: DUF4163 domain-containing protein [Marinomonas sp.]
MPISSRAAIASTSALILAAGLAACGTADDAVANDMGAEVQAAAQQGGTSSTSASSSASSNSDGTSMSTATQSGSGNSSSSSSSTSTSNGAMSTSEETNDYEFSYQWPAAVGRDPALAKIMQGRVEAARSEVKSQSAETRAESAENDFPFRKHSLHINWQEAADTPAFLSLSGNVASYSGGAHGNLFYDGLVWDKKNSQVFAATDFFTSPAALEKAVQPRLCPMLNKERAERRGSPIEQGSTDLFDVCPEIKRINVLLGSSNGKTFDRIGLRFAPYVAGPYAEGTYEMTLPVDAAALKAVDPTYRSAFSLGK